MGFDISDDQNPSKIQNDTFYSWTYLTMTPMFMRDRHESNHTSIKPCCALAPDPDTNDGYEADGDEDDVYPEQHSVDDDSDHVPFVAGVCPLEVVVYMEADGSEVFSQHLQLIEEELLRVCCWFHPK